MVIRYKAQIYQYVGDEVVLSWKERDGLNNLACIKLFRSFEEKLSKRKTFYENKFGVVPVFKAGIDLGTVTVAEIGEIKREIAYHGDVVNTASRIEKMCNKLDRTLLFSEHVERKLNGARGIKCELLGDFDLRGREEKIKLYGLTQNGN